MIPVSSSDLYRAMQTITVTIDGSDLHLISYYTSEDIRSGKLKVRTVILNADFPSSLVDIAETVT
jgi:hypothetical protein